MRWTVVLVGETEQGQRFEQPLSNHIRLAAKRADSTRRAV